MKNQIKQIFSGKRAVVMTLTPLFSEEEISAMRQELDKYGIQMPTFSKIGGILANEVKYWSCLIHG